MSPMGDLPDFDYTINDPSSVECPYCHERTTLDDDEILDMEEIHCRGCGMKLVIQVRTDIVVLAWKPEAMR